MYLPPLSSPIALWIGLALGLASSPSLALAPTPEQQLPVVTVKADALDPDDARAATVSTATKSAIAASKVPQSIDSIEVSKFKTYGVNDLSVMLQGIAGVETYYDTRGEGVMIRGLEASYGDFYRDGIREAGQVRRSTANIERIEVLKGPASVLYGRGSGGGVINLISKAANFDAVSSAGLRAGSWNNFAASLDINHVIHPDLAVRLTMDEERAHSFRSGIKNENRMISPSLLYDNHRGLRWLAQYTHDDVWRVPDRAPGYENLPRDVSLRHGFAHPGDFIEDKLQMFRSVLSYEFAPHWSIKWTASQREAEQNFDHFYLGTFCNHAGRTSTNAVCSYRGQVRQSYAWQQTNNVTRTHMLDLSGKAEGWGLQHELLLGIEITDEERSPRLFSTNSSSSYVDPYHPGAKGWSARPLRGAPSQHNQHETSAPAFYIQDQITLNPQWSLLAGLRYDRYDFHSKNQLNQQSRHYEDQVWSPRLGVVWQPLQAHSLYTSYSKSYAPYGGRGMIGIATTASAVLDAEPQYSRQYEIGLKSIWLDGHLSTQLAYYDLRRYNIRYQPHPTTNPYEWALRGEEGSKGWEFSAHGRVLPKLYLRSSIGFQESTVLEDQQIPSNVGKHLVNTGSMNGSLYARYVPQPQWYVEAGSTFVASQYANAANTLQIPGYARWDAAIGWRPLPWIMTLAVNNLFDKEYWRSNSMPGTPRSVLLSASYLF